MAYVACRWCSGNGVPIPYPNEKYEDREEFCHKCRGTGCDRELTMKMPEHERNFPSALPGAAEYFKRKGI